MEGRMWGVCHIFTSYGTVHQVCMDLSRPRDHTNPLCHTKATGVITSTWSLHTDMVPPSRLQNPIHTPCVVHVGFLPWWDHTYPPRKAYFPGQNLESRYMTCFLLLSKKRTIRNRAEISCNELWWDLAKLCLHYLWVEHPPSPTKFGILHLNF